MMNTTNHGHVDVAADGETARPVDPIMKYFAYAHLKPELQSVSRTFHDVAQYIQDNLPRNAERSVALRKLLEAKDAAVRAALP